MPLPTSGNLSLSQVRTEFGAPSNAPLSAFLRGGAYVPNTSANAGVPTSPPIKLRDLLGASSTPPLSASKSGDASGSYSCTGTASTCPTSANLTTNSVTVTASGGAGSGPNFAWSKISGDTFTIDSPSSASTTFTVNVPRQIPNASRSAVYRCTVTRGTETATVDVNVGASYVYEFDPGGGE